MFSTYIDRNPRREKLPAFTTFVMEFDSYNRSNRTWLLACIHLLLYKLFTLKHPHTFVARANSYKRLLCIRVYAFQKSRFVFFYWETCDIQIYINSFAHRTCMGDLLRNLTRRTNKRLKSDFLDAWKLFARVWKAVKNFLPVGKTLVRLLRIFTRYFDTLVETF